MAQTKVRSGERTPPVNATREQQRIIAAAGYFQVDRRRGRGLALSERIAAGRDLKRIWHGSDERDEALILYEKLLEAVRKFSGKRIPLHTRETTANTKEA